jgi:hypothetical protein
VPAGMRHASVLTLSDAAARRVGWDALEAKIGTAPNEEWRTQDPPTQEVHQ